MVLSGSFSASFGRLGYSDSRASSTSVNVEPSIDQFILPSLSIGLSVFVRYSDSTNEAALDASSLASGGYVRVGANLWLAKSVSFWPVVSLGAWSVSSKYSAPRPGYAVFVGGKSIPIGTSTELKDSAVVAELYAPVLFHLAPHFFVGIGPDAFMDLLHDVGPFSNKRYFAGVSSTVGGWL
jgi:hypothetical protein